MRGIVFLWVWFTNSLCKGYRLLSTCTSFVVFFAIFVYLSNSTFFFFCFSFVFSRSHLPLFDIKFTCIFTSCHKQSNFFLPLSLQHQRKPPHSVRLPSILLKSFSFLLFLIGLIFCIFRFLASELTTTVGQFDKILLLCTDVCFQSNVSLVLFDFQKQR